MNLCVRALLVSSRPTLSALTLLLELGLGWLVDCKKDVGLSIKIVPDCVKVILFQPCLLLVQAHS